MKKRLDILLAEGGFCRSRSEAKDLLLRGFVFIDGENVWKPNKEFDENYFKELSTSKKVFINTKQYVSRGAYKLLFALNYFGIDVNGKVCLDIGSSTGGFTEVLLQNGSKKVFAVDVGKDQFSKTLLEKGEFRNRIILKESTDIRNVKSLDELDSENATQKKGESEENLFADFICCDVSFISVKEIIKVLDKFTRSFAKGKSGDVLNTSIVLLIKPQFEVGRENNLKGVVRNKDLQYKILEDVKTFSKENGFKILGEIESPIEGGDGNLEFLLYLC